LKNASAWEGHFSDPTDPKKEEELERRLNVEFEEPVNEFLGVIET
jgi:hypothetical protein